MISFDRFTYLTAMEARRLPDYVYNDLNLGVTVSVETRLHPAAVTGDLFTLGEYHVGRLGCGITLYYGSFLRSVSLDNEEVVRKKIQEVLRHECLHHLETKAGEFGKGSLIEYDRKQIMEYLRSKE